MISGPGTPTFEQTGIFLKLQNKTSYFVAVIIELPRAQIERGLKLSSILFKETVSDVEEISQTKIVSFETQNKKFSERVMESISFW